MKPRIVRSVASLRRETAAWRINSHRYALVPTMGALHDGHLTLVREALVRADRVIATIFINPKQFAANEDLGRYPRDEDGDVRKLARAGCHLIFAPPPDEMYRDGFATTVSLAGPAKAGLEDKFRPQFFDGVTTVVAKLFHAAEPDVAVFGQKDFQQLAIIRRMVADLDMGVTIVPMPIVREADGLAMSSRNRRLSAAQRAAAACVPRSLDAVAAAYDAGVRDVATLVAAGRRVVDAEPLARFEHLEIVDGATLRGDPTAGPGCVAVTAVWFGDVRLIDNRLL